MDKVLWVAAPLALALAMLLWLVWRRRTPSRLGLNVAFSLLLLAYVLATAGLGIFWVANQQLPVFDWHYLFGYATVLLLVVHLAFNGRVVWHFLRRKAAARRAPDAAPAGAAAPALRPAVPARRPVLGFVGVGGLALAAGAGYLLGMRHGRTELRLVDAGTVANAGAGAPAGAPAAAETSATHAATHAAAHAAAPAAGPAAGTAWAVVEQFHAFSGHSRAGVLRRAASTDWGLAPPPFKRYPGARRLPLPKPVLQPAAARPARAGTAEATELSDLGTWLWLSAGISEERGGIHFRTSPSSGALFATELYVLAIEVNGLAAGLWHYDPEAHALHRLPAAAGGSGGGGDVAASAFGPLPLPAGCRALVVATAVFARSGHKYGDRTYRYVTADLGHTLENLRVAARSAGGHACHLLPRFDDIAIGQALGLEARREGVLAVAALVPDRPAAAAAVAAAASGAAPQVPQPALAPGLASQAATALLPAPGPRTMAHPPAPAEPPPEGGWASPLPDAFAAQGGRLGVTEAMQLATSLRAPAPMSASRPTADAARPAAAGSAITAAAAAGAAPLPAPQALQAAWPQVIATRRSVRRFAATAVPRQALADILWAMTSPAPQLCGAVRIDLLSAAVEGLEPAAWRHDRQQRGLVRRVAHGPALRSRARAAALDQDVIGDAAVVFVLSLDRASLQADPQGPARAYRHGFIEAGLVGERLYLAAGALGLAVCAVGAFYDDEAAALVGVDPAREWVVHFAALGVPA